VATTKRTTAKATAANTEPVAPETGEQGAGVSAGLLQFVDPEAAAKVAAEGKAEDATVSSGDDTVKDESTKEPVAPETGGDNDPEAVATVAGEGEYIVLATAIGSADGRMHTKGQTVTLTGAQAEWLLSRGMVEPA